MPVMGMLVAAPAQAGGLLDFLFGGFMRSPQPRFEYTPPPLEMRVNPSRKRERSVGASSDRKMARQTSIDPVQNPQWYLDDPTLKRGDIVVLKGKVLVYDGGGHGSIEDFTILNRSRLVSAREKERIGRMARRGPYDDSPAAPSAKDASAPAAEPSPREATLRPTN